MKTIINIKADKEIKEQAVKTAKAMGLPLSTVVNAFLRQFVAEQQVTFSVPLVPSKKLEQILKQAERETKDSENIVGPFGSARDMMKALRS
ncbi:MAG: type II toxin-antitoxin system RelB/DinJ family antitoxin [Patescibacteria group bacterium]